MAFSMMALAALDFGIMILGALPSIMFKTEKFYDFTGFSTIVLLTRLSLHYSQKTLHQRIQANMATAWAIRLGSFLFYRVLREGEDKRFRTALQNPRRYIILWILQGVWVILTPLPTLINAQNRRESESLTTRDYIGWGVFVVGFLIEVIADYQKWKFRSDPDNAGQFITHGLWSISRHPNYFGEILLWFGLFLSASTSFRGWQWASIVSPVSIYYLLTTVTGIPVLEKAGLKRWGELPEYENYIQNVPVLVPFIGKP